MIAKVFCGALHGVDAFTVSIEVDYTRSGMPAFTMVGLAEAAVRESRERVFTALRNSGLKLSPARVTVNLAPADRKKGGTGFDLPLAIGLLQAAEILPEKASQNYFIAGELSLSGHVKPVPGVLPLAILARNSGAKGIIVPLENAREASIIDGLNVYGVESLGQAAAFFSGQTALEPYQPPVDLRNAGNAVSFLDFIDVKGQEHAKRAVEIAAAGGHNLLFIGPPGSGKTMLASRIPTVMPELSFEEILEVSKIYSVAGMLSPDKGMVCERPFRAPHHTISEQGLIGGGMYPKPGEISLAHRGVIFLDELLEFKKNTLEVLRQPLEQGEVTVSRVAQSITYPADVMLVAAMNPCPCGYYGDAHKPCVCTPAAVQKYRSRLSGPLLDRIDLHVEVPPVPYDDLKGGLTGRSSGQMRQSVRAARAIQDERYADLPIDCNAQLAAAPLEEFCKLDSQGHAFLRTVMQSLNLSARAYTRVLRIARTIADLDGQAGIAAAHLAEAVNYRSLDRPDIG